MRNVPLLLARAAALFTVAACSGCSDHQSSTTTCGSPPATHVTLTTETACALAEATGPAHGQSFSSACSQACGSKGAAVCTLPSDYVDAFVAASQSDSGDVVLVDGGDAGGPSRCPVRATGVDLTCNVDCTGRRTEGAGELVVGDGLSASEYLAACAHLEAVSVHAFERLADELTVHGAPAALVDAARVAAREEVRHAEVTASLASRLGGAVVQLPAPLVASPARSLFEVALENAVEGCVRETFGAALALVRAERATDADVRRELATIAREECGHADLSWRIASWAEPLLDDTERATIAAAKRDAVAGLAFRDERVSPEARSACGIPGAAEQRALAKAVDVLVIRSAA